MISQMVNTSPQSTDRLEFSFSPRARVAAPVAVGLLFGAVVIWALWSRGFGLGAWLAIAAVIFLVAAEAHKRSMAIVVTSTELVERDLLGQRTLPLARLERARLFRNERLWLYFAGEPKPVWFLKGMGDPRAVMDLVVSRAQVHGAQPEIVRTEKA